LLANGSVVGEVLTSHVPGLRQLLITYPLITGGAFTVAPGDGSVHFGVELNLNSPPVCTKGYGGTRVRFPQDTRNATLTRKASCKGPPNSPIDVRGSRNAPLQQTPPQLPPGATSGAGFPYEHSDGRPSNGQDGSTQQTSSTGQGDLRTLFISP